MFNLKNLGSPKRFIEIENLSIEATKKRDLNSRKVIVDLECVFNNILRSYQPNIDFT